MIHFVARNTLALSLALLALSACNGGGVPRDDGGSDADVGLDADGLDADREADGEDADADTDSDVGGPLELRPVYDLESARSGAFFDAPYPSDARLTTAGAPDLVGFYPPHHTSLIDGFITEIARDIRGFSSSGGIYFRFTSALDPGSLPPDTAASIASDASVYIVDVDPESADSGRRWPAEVTFYEEGGRYYQPNTLVIRPPLGMPLRGGGVYAAVVTTAIRGAEDQSPLREPAFDALLESTAPAEREDEWLALQPLVELLRDREELETLLIGTVFTVGDPLAEMVRARDWILSNTATPVASRWELLAEPNFLEPFATYRGTFALNEFLSGEPPYREPGEGVIFFDEAGEPLLSRTVDVRFVLTVPAGEPPSGGWPLALYSHGAGGDATSFIEPEAAWAAEVGVAMISMDNPMNGERDPEGGSFVDYLVELAMTNVPAGRDMYRHGILDQLQLLRLVRGDFNVPDAISHSEEAIHFDRSRVQFTSHSMGSQIGTMFVAVEPGIHAAFFSAGGGSASTSFLLRKANDIDIEAVVALLLGVDLEEEPLGLDHPVVGLLIQTLLDPADPLCYAYGAIREAGDAPLSILMTEGLLDDQTTPPTVEALSAAFGLPIVEPMWRESAAHTIWGLDTVTAPLRDNIELADVPVTGGVMQVPEQGHYSLYRDENAQLRFRAWLESAASGTPVIVALD